MLLKLEIDGVQEAILNGLASAFDRLPLSRPSRRLQLVDTRLVAIVS